MKTLKTIAAAAALTTVAAVAWAQMNHGAHGGGGMMMDMGQMQTMMDAMMPAEGDTDSTRAFKQADMTMMRDMAVPYTGNADVDFRLKMILTTRARSTWQRWRCSTRPTRRRRRWLRESSRPRSARSPK